MSIPAVTELPDLALPAERLVRFEVAPEQLRRVTTVDGGRRSSKLGRLLVESGQTADQA